MNVLSLFDGMSCGQLALNKANIKYDKYYASEIKKFAIELTKHHYPNTIHVGDVCKLRAKDLPKIDLLIGGSPCQDFSNVKINGKGLEGDKSRLFYEYLRLYNECKPKYFLLENVKMKDFSKNQLDNYLGVSGILINSSLVSYQTRARYYWTNIPNVTVPTDKNINFQDYKETNKDICKQYKLKKTKSRLQMWNNGLASDNVRVCKNITHSHKVGCLLRKQDRSPNSGLIEFEDFCRFLTREELEQAQTVPIGYTGTLSYNQAQDVLGDGWTIDVIAHILKGLKQKNKTSTTQPYQLLLQLGENHGR